MASAGLELQKAIYQKLRSDAALVALLGGAKVYDDVPQGTAFPYITFGRSLVRDWATGTEAGHETRRDTARLVAGSGQEESP